MGRFPNTVFSFIRLDAQLGHVLRQRIIICGTCCSGGASMAGAGIILVYTRLHEPTARSEHHPPCPERSMHFHTGGAALAGGGAPDGVIHGISAAGSHLWLRIIAYKPRSAPQPGRDMAEKFFHLTAFKCVYRLKVAKTSQNSVKIPFSRGEEKDRAGHGAASAC